VGRNVLEVLVHEWNKVVWVALGVGAKAWTSVIKGAVHHELQRVTHLVELIRSNSRLRGSHNFLGSFLLGRLFLIFFAAFIF
jgi:hypothetical protein